MTDQATAKTDPTREVTLNEWGKVLLEEVLFRGAEHVSRHGASGDSVLVTLSFSLKPNLADGCIEVSIPGAVEKSITTRLQVHDSTPPLT